MHSNSAKLNVLIAGGGNAALCAAISARRSGASVAVFEVASEFYRGGNTRHTRNIRCAHDTATETLTGPYSEDEFWDITFASPKAARTKPRQAYDPRLQRGATMDRRAGAHSALRE